MSEMKPALTAEEWRDALGGYGYPVGDAVYHAQVEAGRAADFGQMHKAAALALHGQAYGFTWEDVDALRDVAHDYAADFPGRPMLAILLRELADRIAALLPPREG